MLRSVAALRGLGDRFWLAALGLACLTTTQPLLAQVPPPVTRVQAPSPRLADPVAGSSSSTNDARPPASAASMPADSAARNTREPGRERSEPEIAPDSAAPGEFERLAAQANSGRPVGRFGAQLRRSGGALSQLEVPARVPPAYVVQVGDELSVTLWGSIEADLRLRVDRAGRVSLPRVGPVAVAGATAAELEPLMRARLERVFRNFELNAAVTDVSPIRIHLTGFVERPGDYVVPGLTTISGALAQAQGPSAGGSFRRVRLQRNDSTVVSFDLYTLLAEGTRRDDRLLQPGDVLHVEAAGPQVALLGSVNRAAVFEFLPGETVRDLLRLAGGFSSVADRSRLTLERLQNRVSVGATELQLPRDQDQPLVDGDILQAVSQVAALPPSQQRNKRVRVEGEVLRPGEYLLPPSATLADAVQAAGGATPAAFFFGAELRRERVRQTQEANYERALQELEAEIGRSTAARTTENTPAVDANTRQLLTRLRNRRPEGRIVLDLAPAAQQLPALELEDGDQVRLPSRSQSVGVFGSVFNAGSFVHDPQRDLGFYMQRAGGATDGADYPAVFVVRANGSVISARQSAALFNATGSFEQQGALPGDTLIVPEKLDRVNFVQGAKDWTQILYQFGLGVAALLAIL
jgi:protein involved in polysaccharide export with SLBB domain